MSLSQSIKSRLLQDCINEGLKVAITGLTGGAVTDQVILALPPSRAMIVCGLIVSTDSAAAVLVSLGFKPLVGPTKTFFTGYVSNQAGPITSNYQVGDWYRGSVNEPIVITTTANAAYSIDTRVTQETTVTGYIEHEGTDLHAGRAYFPDQNGANRGQSEV